MRLFTPRLICQLSRHSSYQMSNISDVFFSQKQHALKEVDMVVQKGVKKLKKVKMQDNIEVDIPDINPIPKVRYAFEKDGITNVPRYPPLSDFINKNKREVYVPPVKRSIKMKIQKQEYEKFMQSALNQSKQESKEKTIDDLWDGAQQPIRYYSKVKYSLILLLIKTSTKDLYFNYREQDFDKVIARKNDYLSLLTYEVNNKPIFDTINQIHQISIKELAKVHDPNYFIEEDHYLLNPETKELFIKLGALMNTVSYSEIPAIAMMLNSLLRYKIDVFKIWEKVDRIIEQHIHNLTIPQILQLKYATASTYPKALSDVTQNKLLQVIEGELSTMSIEETMHILAAFRLLPNEKLTDKIIEGVRSTIAIYASDPNLLVELLYSIANNLPKKHLRKLTIDYDSDKKKRLALIQHFIDPIKEGSNKLTSDNMVRLALSVQLMRLPNFDDVFLHIETNIQYQQLDGFHVSQLLYAFSKGNNGYSVGSKEFYTRLSPMVNKYWGTWGDLTKSRVYYAYCANDIIIENDHKKLYIPWIKQSIEGMSYSELQNVAYGLMFTKNTSVDIWRSLARNIGLQKEIVPLVNFFAIKQAYYYMLHHFPQYELGHIREACFEAENQFSVLRLQRSLIDSDQSSFYALLQDLFEFEWKNFYSFENLYLLGSVIPTYKVALLLQTQRNTLPDGRPRPQLRLQQEILQYSDFNAQIINYKDIVSTHKLQHKSYLEKVIKAAMEAQKPKFKIWEQDRRAEIYDKLVRIDEQRTTPGLPIPQADDFDQLDRKV